jgi:hypothetical protein
MIKMELKLIVKENVIRFYEKLVQKIYHIIGRIPHSV